MFYRLVVVEEEEGGGGGSKLLSFIGVYDFNGIGH